MEYVHTLCLFISTSPFFFKKKKQVTRLHLTIDLCYLLDSKDIGVNIVFQVVYCCSLCDSYCQELERQLAAKEASLPQEPASDDENAVTLLVRMPDGSRRGRRFLKSDKLQVNSVTE
jgi:hypothetical protein